MDRKYRSFEEFYPFYLSQHAKPGNRLLHFVGLWLVLLWIAFCVWQQNWFLLIAVPVIGYGLAWMGHFFIERNRPATFQYPWWSLRGDFRLFLDILRARRLDFDRSNATKNSA